MRVNPLCVPVEQSAGSVYAVFSLSDFLQPNGGMFAMKSSPLAPLDKLARDQRGLSTLEYVVLFVIIVVGALTFWSKLGGKLTENLSGGTDAFNRVVSGEKASQSP